MSSCKTVNMMLLRGMTAKRNVCIGVYSSMRGLQNCFDAGKLSVCATTRQSRLYQWMIGPHRSSAHQYVEHLSLPQLSRHRSFTTPLHCGSASPDQLSVYPLYPFFTVVRFRRRKMNRKPEASQEASADEVNCQARIMFILTLMLRGENTLQNAEYGMRNSNTYTLRNYRCGMFGYLLAVGTIVNVATRLFSK